MTLKFTESALLYKRSRIRIGHVGKLKDPFTKSYYIIEHLERFGFSLFVSKTLYYMSSGTFKQIKIKAIIIYDKHSKIVFYTILT